MKRHHASTFEQALDAARSGEGWAFERLYKSHAQPITAFATVRGAEDPEAIANDVFLKAFRALASFSGDERAFKGWLFSIARNLLIDAYRQSSRRPMTSTTPEIPHGSVASAESEALDSMSAANVAAILSCLSNDQREVIALRLVADLTLKQVAEITGKPVTAVKALQRRGMRRLQKELGTERSPNKAHQRFH